MGIPDVQSTGHPVKRIRGRALQRRNARLRAKNPLCVRCEAKGIVRPATQWDHIEPLCKGGADDESNLQGLCDDCHLEKTAEDMGHRRRLGGDVNGLPLDPDHHWNTGEGGRNP